MSSVHSLPHNPVARLAGDHPGIVRAGRAGWFAKGVVYFVAGVLALLSQRRRPAGHRPRLRLIRRRARLVR